MSLLRSLITRSSFLVHAYQRPCYTTVADKVRRVMRKVPQPVVVVTTAKDDYRRGITVSSFTSICLHPEPLVSFCVKIPSRASELLHSSGGMVVNILSHDQVKQSIAFASPNQTDQFKDIPYYDDPVSRLPVLMGTLGSMHCKVFKVHELGDHELWITKVINVDYGVGSVCGKREEDHPLLYYDRGYRGVGEQVFMKALETMDQNHWTHRALVRMAWNYLREMGRQKATPVIQDTIRRHYAMNPRNMPEYHETTTLFYIHLIDVAIQSSKAKDDDDFFEFIEQFPILTDRTTIKQFYSPQVLKTMEARHNWVEPDLQPLPTNLIPSQPLKPLVEQSPIQHQ